ncbi:MAG: heavy metal sensor histidine kinase [Thiobacillaceae bacterium]
MKPLSLTNRIALLFAVVVVVVLGMLGFVLDRAVDAHFRDMDRHVLAGKLELVGNLLAKAGDRAALDALPQQLDDALVGHRGLALAVLDGDGRVWFASTTETFPHPLLQAARRHERSLITWTADGRPYRGLAARMSTGIDPGRPYTVAVALDIRHHAEFMLLFRRTLALAMLLAAIVTAALGWAVTSRALAPLREIGATAASISASRLDARLPLAGLPPELAALAHTFNQMLDRLEDAFRRLADFSADIAHELRTPVSNLMTQTQVVMARSRDADAYREALASALEEYERLARMIDDMLFLAKADNRLIAPRREELNLEQEVQRLIEFHEAVAEEAGVALKLSGEARVVGDRLMLQRALANLLGNAIRHTDRGKAVQVRLDQSEGGVLIAVENPGPAIPPEHLPRLFDRFYRADPARREGGGEHTGLGLAIVKSIVEAHGGEVSVQSRPALTRFEIRLPAAA